MHYQVGLSNFSDATIGELAQGMVNNYIDQFEGSYFGEVISLGDKEIFSRAFEDVDVVYSPGLSSTARYTQAGWWSNPRIEISRDISKPSNYNDIMLSQTVWHEMIHRLEDMNGDFDTPDSGNEYYQERNVEYMQNVVMAIRYLEVLERQAKDGVSDEELSDVWDNMISRYEEAMEIESAAVFKPDLNQIKEWTGFEVDPEKIMQYYLDGNASDRLQEFARHYRGVSGESSGRFPDDGDFNGMIINYDISGIEVSNSSVNKAFMTSKSLEGYIGGSEIRVSGTARMGSGFGAKLTVRVDTSTGSKEYESYIESGHPNYNSDDFELVIPISPKDRYASVSIRMDGEYSMGGGWRGL